jgi:hypothetical protein
MTRFSRFGSWALLGVLAACAPERIPPPSAPRPVLERPAEAIPADLDLVVRIDFARVKNALGAELLRSLAEQTPPAGDAASEKLLVDAIARADTIWVALRPASDLEASDNVIVLRGRFSDLDPLKYGGEPRWRGPVDLGAAVRRYERPAPALRSAPARIYVRLPDLMVFASAAEIDSVERVIEEGADDPRLDPPEKGALALEGRIGRLSESIAERSPAAARLLAPARRLRAYVDLEASGIQGELELEFELEEQARRAADATALFARALAESGGTASRIVGALRVEAVGSTLVVGVGLGAEQLAELLACARGDRECA